MPIFAYSQICGQKMKLLIPDTEENQAAVKRYQQQGNKEAAKIEAKKMRTMRRSHGIYPMLGALNLLQLPLHMVYIALINRLSYNFNIQPSILTDGVLWFKDLSSPDPTGILPVLGGGLLLLTMMSSSNNTNSNPMFRKISKYMKVMPLLTIPIWMTFPAAFNVYWIVS